MTIPEHQLSSWSSVGAQKGSADTYASIKHALNEHEFPSSMTFDVFLQGSYPNTTNIRGDSDVDIVVQTSEVFYHNVRADQRSQYGLNTPGDFTLDEFRREVLSALKHYYGSDVVRQGNKCIKVAGNQHRLNADVVPCTEYRNYSKPGHYKVGGIRFLTQNNIEIINYPKVHLANGSEKNKDTDQHYKPNVRVFKNARNRAGSNFPSYFLECLLFNVPAERFSASHSETFYDVLSYLVSVRDARLLGAFTCQNCQQSMFGNKEHQISLIEAEACIEALAQLWDFWR